MWTRWDRFWDWWFNSYMFIKIGIVINIISIIVLTYVILVGV